MQLYEKQKLPMATLSYKLVKEWKNSTVNNKDPVVAVGSFRNQYLYTCSYDGKLVIRDLINDDADDSVKTYLIDGPISCLRIQPLRENMRVLVAAGGQDNEMKLYDLDFGLSMASNLNRLYSVGVRPNMTTVVRLLNALPDQRRMTLRRNLFHNFSTYLEWRRLVPVFQANSGSEETGTWILSVCFANNDKPIVCCGTQFGDLLVYSANADSYENEEPSKVFHLSSFPINQLHTFGRYLAYTDTMSKMGIIDTVTFSVVNFYDYLKIGPTVSLKIYTSHETTKSSHESAVSKFKPVYLVAATIDGNIVVYKLTDNNETEYRLLVTNAGIVPDLDVLETDAYNELEKVFGDLQECQAPVKKRKRETLSFLVCGPGHQGPDARNPELVQDTKPVES